jgi:HSP20 family protein
MATTALEKKEERLQRREPLDMFDEMQEAFRRFWTEPWSFFARRPLGRTLNVPTNWFPRVDMYEKKDHLFVKVDLPGMKKEDIQVSVDKGDLVIRGESKAESEVKEEDYYRMERTAGQFYRRLPLPFEAKTDKIEANFKDGVLEVRIPSPPTEKKPEPQKIPIR